MVNVVLVARADIRSFLPGVVSAVLYGWFFLAQKYYGNAALSLLYYLPMQGYGYWVWKTRGPKKDDDLALQAKGPLTLLAAVVVSGAIAFPIHYFLVKVQGQATTLDAATTAVSIVAQVLLSWKWAENWPLWAGVNVAYVALFLNLQEVWEAAFFRKSLSVAMVMDHLTRQTAWPSAALYAALFGIALWGWWKWAKAAREDRAHAA